MAKKKKSGISLGAILTVAAAVLGLVAFFMMFAPAAAVENADTTYSGVNLTFGYSFTVPLINKEITVFGFSFMNLLAYILVIAGIVFGVLSALGKLGKISGIVSAVCYIVAGIFFFCVVQFTVLDKSFADIAQYLDFTGKEGLSLGAGAIVAGVLSIVSAVATVAGALFIKK